MAWTCPGFHVFQVPGRQRCHSRELPSLHYRLPGSGQHGLNGFVDVVQLLRGVDSDPVQDSIVVSC